MMTKQWKKIFEQLCYKKYTHDAELYEFVFVRFLQFYPCIAFQGAHIDDEKQNSNLQ